MNAISYVLIIVIAAAAGYGIFRMIRRKGRCACCDGSCPGCGGTEDCAAARKKGKK